MNTQQKPKISIIVPIFSAEKYLASCVESLINQTHSNIEIILVNDGSTDKSGELCEKYASIDERITVIHKENGGVSSARNAGLDIATGEWIGFVDADDIAEPDMYEYLLNAAIENGADIVQCAMIFETENNAYRVCNPPSDLIANGDKNLSDDFFKHLSGGVCCKLFKSSLIKELRYDQNFSIGEDMRFNLDALVNSKRALLKTEAKYHYIQQKGSATNSVPTKQSLTSYLKMLEKAKLDFEKHITLLNFLNVETIKAAMDVCSKAVRFGFDKIFCEARQALIESKSHTRRSILLTKKQKIKSMLIAHFPCVYKIVLKTIK